MSANQRESLRYASTAARLNSACTESWAIDSTPHPAGPTSSTTSSVATLLLTPPGPSHEVQTQITVQRKSSRHKFTAPRVRSTKACELCRTKRIRCQGVPPCQACIRAGNPDACIVRLKARPGRVKHGTKVMANASARETRQHRRMTSTEGHSDAGSESSHNLDSEVQSHEAQGSYVSLGSTLDISPSDSFGATLEQQPPHQPFLRHPSHVSQQINIDPDASVAVIGTAGIASLSAPTAFDDVAQILQQTQVPTMAENSSSVFEFDRAQASSFRPSLSPLAQVEANAVNWALCSDVDPEQLIFKAEGCLAASNGTPLPLSPLVQALEDLLINSLLMNEESSTQEILPSDRDWLLSLYRRYREIPEALNDDQKGLIYSILCLARFALIRSEMNATPNGGFNIHSTTREDITYYHLALAALDRWNRQSLTAFQAYIYLQIFTVGAGGPSDTKAVQSRMAWQVITLQLHRRQALDLYPSPEREQASAYVSAFLNTDYFRALLTNLEPTIPISELNLDIPPFVPYRSSTPFNDATICTARFLADYNNPNIDTSGRAYITETETRWREQLRQLRPSVNRGKREVNWADFRYNWMRLLLYIPRLAESDMAMENYAVIIRCVSRILYTYYELVDLQELNPSWPQIARLAVCGQLLILVCDAGELHRRESSNLFTMLVHLLALHKHTWPFCERLITGFMTAARTLGMDVGQSVFVDSAVIVPTASIQTASQGGQELDLTQSQAVDGCSLDAVVAIGMESASAVANTGTASAINIEDLFLGSFEGYPWSDLIFGDDPGGNISVPDDMDAGGG